MSKPGCSAVRPPETLSRTPKQEISVVSRLPTVWYGGPEQTNRTCTWPTDKTTEEAAAQTVYIELRPEIWTRQREKVEETIQLPIRSPFLLLLFQDSRKERRRMRRRKEFITELKPEPGFLYCIKYVGGSGQTITISQVPCKRVFQIISLCTETPFI